MPIHTRRQPRGICWLEYDSPSGAAAAKEGLDGTAVGGQKVNSWGPWPPAEDLRVNILGHDFGLLPVTAGCGLRGARPQQAGGDVPARPATRIASRLHQPQAAPVQLELCMGNPCAGERLRFPPSAAKTVLPLTSFVLWCGLCECLLFLYSLFFLPSDCDPVVSSFWRQNARTGWDHSTNCKSGNAKAHLI